MRDRSKKKRRFGVPILILTMIANALVMLLSTWVLSRGPSTIAALTINVRGYFIRFQTQARMLHLQITPNSPFDAGFNWVWTSKPQVALLRGEPLIGSDGQQWYQSVIRRKAIIGSEVDFLGGPVVPMFDAKVPVVFVWLLSAFTFAIFFYLWWRRVQSRKLHGFEVKTTQSE